MHYIFCIPDKHDNFDKWWKNILIYILLNISNWIGTGKAIKIFDQLVFMVFFYIGNDFQSAKNMNILLYLPTACKNWIFFVSKCSFIFIGVCYDNNNYKDN